MFLSEKTKLVKSYPLSKPGWLTWVLCKKKLMEKRRGVRILSQIGCRFLFQEPGEVEIWKSCPRPNPVQRSHLIQWKFGQFRLAAQSMTWYQNRRNVTVFFVVSRCKQSYFAKDFGTIRPNRRLRVWICGKIERCDVHVVGLSIFSVRVFCRPVVFHCISRRHQLSQQMFGARRHSVSSQKRTPTWPLGSSKKSFFDIFWRRVTTNQFLWI